jgi:transglutaminase-like putative cysteine protease
MRASRWWDLSAVCLLIAALLTAASRLVATEWVGHLSLAHTLVLLGVAAGLALGQSIFSPALATLFGVLYGLFAVPWQLCLTTGRLSEEALWSDRLIVLASRLTQTLTRFAQQEPVYDPVLFLFAMAALAWSLSVHAGYALTRRGSPWRIILPPGLAALLIHTADLYRPRGIWYLAVYLFFSLLLLARLTFLRLRRDWLQEDARIPPLVGLDMGYAMVAAVVVMVLLAWAAPAMADILPAARQVWDRATRPWEERMDELFASLRRRGATITASNYYGDDFPLGRGRELSDDLVLSVQVPEVRSSVRYYWRARVYDRYDEGRWSTEALSVTERLGPGGSTLSFPALEGRRSVTFTFTSPEPIVTLYVAPQPRWVDQRVEVEFAQNPDATVDVGSLRAIPSVDAGETYVARSSMAAMTVSQLRDAGTDYPPWITDRYLDLPDTMTARMQELAEQIGEGQETPYDVVAAVTRYLRNNIRYSETITGTPAAGQEPLDWFLFDLRVGFCNYYASSEVILLRSLGIPARLAVGFAEGQHQRGTTTTLVYERNAHAWPEVYFPGFGWVEFEPTVSEDPLYRPLGEIETEDEGGFRVPAGGDTEDRWRERLEELRGIDDEIYSGDVPTGWRSRWDRIRPLAAVGSILLGVILAILAWRAWRRRRLRPLPVLLEMSVRRLGLQPPAFLRRWAHQALLSPLERAYGEIDRALVRLGAAPPSADTPGERAASLADLLPLVAEPTSLLLAEYQAGTYSPHPCSVSQAEEAARSIRKLSWQAKLRRLIRSPARAPWWPFRQVSKA